MDSWVLVADQPRDLVARDLPHVIVSSEDYVARPYMLGGARQKLIILARSYNYGAIGGMSSSRQFRAADSKS